MIVNNLMPLSGRPLRHLQLLSKPGDFLFFRDFKLLEISKEFVKKKYPIENLLMIYTIPVDLH